MSISEKENFKVEIIKKSDESVYEDFLSPENKIYICSEPNTTFFIRMTAKDPFINYGVKLYLDGKEYPHKKVFKKIGHYFGFKLGHGKYREFLFKKTCDLDKSDYEGGDIMREDIKGTIKIDFYETKRIYKKISIKDPAKYVPYKPFEKNEDKKLCFNSTTIKEGDIIDLKLHDKWVENIYKNYKDKDYYFEYVLDEEKKIDTITIHYMEFISMILNGYLSLSNINHLYLAPDDNLEYCLQSIETILKYFHPRTFNLEDLPGLYFEYTRKDLDRFLKGYPLKKFVERFTNRFFVVDGSLRINSKRLNNFVNTINVDYVLTPNEKEFIKLKPQLIKELNENYIKELQKEYENKNPGESNQIKIEKKEKHENLSPLSDEEEGCNLTNKYVENQKYTNNLNCDTPITCSNDINSSTIFDSFLNKKRGETDLISNFTNLNDFKEMNDIIKIQKELAKIKKFKKILEAEKEVVCINLLDDD